MKYHVSAVLLASAVLAKNEPCGSRTSCEANCIAGDYTISRNGLPVFVCYVGAISGKAKNVNICAYSSFFDVPSAELDGSFGRSKIDVIRVEDLDAFCSKQV